jgi:protoporphyrinogen oxidase
MKIAIIGAGIAGLSAGRVIADRGHHVTLFENNTTAGGLVRCERVDGNLYHKIGGHVFNSKNQDVLDWFWKYFDRDTEFVKARRDAKIYTKGRYVGYPIENHLSQLPESDVRCIVKEVLDLHAAGYTPPEAYENFEGFLRGNFGETLFQSYFKPYNEKIWQCRLSEVGIKWLDGKLPMPNYEEMLCSSILGEAEGEMVHSNFYYPKNNGSQFIADRLAEGLDVKLDDTIESIDWVDGHWEINGEGDYDGVVFTGDVRTLNSVIHGVAGHATDVFDEVADLQVNGTSNMLCKTADMGDISWLYLPDSETPAHRIIYTGNFSKSNNAKESEKTCVVEFSGKFSPSEMEEQIAKLPGDLRPIASNYEASTYVIQKNDTRAKIQAVKDVMTPHNFWLHGRFAEWEYYNMDTVILSSLKSFGNL